MERWRRVALASVKQSRRAVLPEIRVPLTLENALTEPAAALRMMLVEPTAGARAEPMSALQGAPAPSDATLFVGPEGGWAEDEWASAAAHGGRVQPTARGYSSCTKSMRTRRFRRRAMPRG